MAKRLNAKEKLDVEARKAIERINNKLRTVNEKHREKQQEIEKVFQAQINALVAERAGYEEALKLLGAESPKAEGD